MKKIAIVLICCLIILGSVLFLIFNNKDKNKKEPILERDFNAKIINEVHKNQSKKMENYLISPYSIEMALRMLSEGTDTTTFDEIDKLIGKRTMPTFMSKNRISVANALFLKDKYKDIINKDFVDSLKNDYDAEVLIDKFKTPDKINEWVNKKTYEMIPTIIDSIDKSFVLGLANAIAIDVEWDNKFECTSTTPVKFKNVNGDYDVEMMHKDFNNIKYINNGDLKGIVIPYTSYNSKGEVSDEEEGISLEFVGILPKDLDSYIKTFNKNRFNEMVDSFRNSSSKESVKLAIPRFTYDFSLDLKSILENIGIKEIFTGDADFTKVFGEKGYLYISDAIHKTHIELNEHGTKAAAVTYFGMTATAMIEDNKVINITFDKPFVYAIRDVKSKELLFVGVVYSPNKWKSSTCEGK